MIGAVARGVVSRLWLALARGTPGRIPEDQRHHWQEKHGLGGGWTCDRCKKPASACYGRERFYCSGAPERIVIVPSPRPEDDGDDFRVDGVRIDWPTYHVLLNHLCTELGVPGAQSFWQAVAWVKKRAPQRLLRLELDLTRDCALCGGPIQRHAANGRVDGPARCFCTGRKPAR